MLSAQDTMQNFTRRGSRHVLFADDRYGSRPFVAGNSILAPVDDLIRYRRFAVPRDDHGVNPLAPLRIGNADDGDIFYLGMGSYKRLYFRRIDILSARDDHVAFAIDQKNVAVIVPAGEVADRAIVSAKGLFRLVGQLPVPVEGV